MTHETLRQRLDRLSDDELVEIVRKHDLDQWQAAVFPIAEELLHSRGVDVAQAVTSSEAAPVPAIEAGFVPVARFATVVEAEACRSALLAGGFTVVGQDQFLLGVDPALGPALGGFRLAVPADEVEDAIAFLAAADQGDLGAGLLECSSCGSTDVATNRKTTRGGTFMNTLVVGPVVEDVSVSFRCQKCGATWE